MSGHNLLQIDSSARGAESVTAQLTQYAQQAVLQKHKDLTPIYHHLGSNPLPQVSAEQLRTVHGSLETNDAETLKQVQLSESLVEEVLNTRYLIIGAPMYNFGIPANLKVWVDHICRAGKTFRYTENGPEGLSNIETAIIVVASGGAPIGSDWDYVSSYLKHIMAFIGVKNTIVIDAGGSQRQVEETIDNAKTQIDAAIQTL